MSSVVAQRVHRILDQLPGFQRPSPQNIEEVDRALHGIDAGDRILGFYSEPAGSRFVVSTHAIRVLGPSGWRAIPYRDILDVEPPAKSDGRGVLRIRVVGAEDAELYGSTEDLFEIARFLLRVRTDSSGVTVKLPRPVPVWTHPSIKALKVDDPVEWVQTQARSEVFRAIEAGWSGPPFDPFVLAEIKRIDVRPATDVGEARLVGSDSHLEIHYNPLRSPARQRYSVAHELAHSLFPDASAKARYRHEASSRSDEWQLEILCNLAAAELLMPTGSLTAEGVKSVFSIDDAEALRQRFAVSLEAVLLRLLHTSSGKVAVFAASPGQNSKYRLDYWIASARWNEHLPVGRILDSPLLAEGRHVGFTIKGTERWSEEMDFAIEAMALPPYPGLAAPRVVGIARPVDSIGVEPKPRIVYLRGDALEPRSSGRRIVAFVVNDKAAKWGGGFARQVGTQFPRVQEEFKAWAKEHGLALGVGVLLESDDPTLAFFPMVAQHDYRQQVKPGIRYRALETALKALADIAVAQHASVHMPRIGVGLARGNWAVVSELIDECLIAAGVLVTVYDLPGAHTGGLQLSSGS